MPLTLDSQETQGANDQSQPEESPVHPEPEYPEPVQDQEPVQVSVKRVNKITFDSMMMDTNKMSESNLLGGPAGTSTLYRLGFLTLRIMFGDRFHFLLITV